MKEKKPKKSCTVEQLIDRLSAFDPDARIAILNTGGDYEEPALTMISGSKAADLLLYARSDE